MEQLQNLFNDRITNFLESGKLEEKIDHAVSKCFDDCIDSAFRWGDLKKSIEQVITEKMRISLNEIPIQSYNSVLEEALRQKMAKFSSEAATQMFSDALSEMFKEAPKEISMEKLAQKILDDLRDGNDDPSDYGKHYTVEFKNTHGNSYTFRILEDGSRYSSKKVHLYLIDRDDHHNIAINHEMDITNPTCLHGIDRELFLMYAGRTKIMDVDSFDPDDLDTRKTNADY